MDIPNSSTWAYWPEINPLMADQWWSNEDEDWYKDQQASSAMRIGAEIIGGNVSWNLINFWIDTYAGDGSGPAAHCPIGFLDRRHEFFSIWDVAIENRLPAGAGLPLPTDWTYHIQAMGCGLWVWQRYHLKLSFQVDKLINFGYRGR